MSEEEYILMACFAIRRYLQNEGLDDATIQSLYPLAVKRLSMRVKEMDTVRINGVKSYSSDGQDFSFNEKDPLEITPDIAALLPKKTKFYAW
ncbi:hypothetical protein [Clostridium beijerinckii]|uniref:hypothetical protein n=1 Tax=Clostridium beijerinckii TaxID=1520 RepID=UPI00047E3916|nr:hypothetical protein [Clostridium beijerinckii]